MRPIPAPDGVSPEVAPAFKRPVSRAYVILAALGWLAAGFFFWLQSIGQEPPRAHCGRAERGPGDAQSRSPQHNGSSQQPSRHSRRRAIRLRDEAAEALQDIREEDGPGKQGSCNDRNELDDIRQKIAAQSSELANTHHATGHGAIAQSQGTKQAWRALVGLLQKSCDSRDSSFASTGNLHLGGQDAAAHSKLHDIRLEIAARSCQTRGHRQAAGFGTIAKISGKEPMGYEPLCDGGHSTTPAHTIHPFQSTPSELDRSDRSG